MFNVLTLNKIAACGTDLLDKSKYTVGDDIANPDAILVRSASMHEMELPSNLLAIARAGAGVNNIPIDKCSEKGVVVFNTPGANANATPVLSTSSARRTTRCTPLRRTVSPTSLTSDEITIFQISPETGGDFL